MAETMTFRFREKSLKLQRGKPLLMGILNVTPDSFSDGGRYDQCDAALRHARQMLAEGASIIDLGGESTRPGHTPVPVEEELRRIMPVLKELRIETDLPISIDTTKAAVAEAALEAGADIINDVSALGDPEMPRVAARHKAGCILMHAKTIASSLDAADEVARWLGQRLTEAQGLTGLDAEHFVIDPGIGFGKDFHQNLNLIAHLDRLENVPAPVLLAMSRKSFINAATNTPDPAERLPGTIAAALYARKSCHLLRVHDVAPIRQALAMIQALEQC